MESETPPCNATSYFSNSQLPETGGPLWLLGELFQMIGLFEPLRVMIRSRNETRVNTMVVVRSLPSRAVGVPRCMWHPLTVVIILWIKQGSRMVVSWSVFNI